MVDDNDSLCNSTDKQCVVSQQGQRADDASQVKASWGQGEREGS